MRVLFTIDFSLDNIGGAMTSLVQQAQALTDAGHQVTIAALGNEKSSNVDSTPKSPEIVFIKPSFRLNKTTMGLPVIINKRNNREKIKRLFDCVKPDVVHTQSELSLSTMIISEAKFRNIPTVSTVHTFFWDSRGYPFQWLLALLVKLTTRLVTGNKIIDSGLIPGSRLEVALKSIAYTAISQVDMVISPSVHQAKALAESGLKTSIKIIPNPFSSPTQSAKRRLVSKTDPLRLAWVGRIDPEKRPDVFLKAVQLARQSSGHRILVDIIGDGVMMSELRRDFTHPDTNFLGQSSRDTVINCMDKSHAIAVSSYHFDNQPMVIAEAITRWRPVIYCDERLTEGTSFAGYFIPSPTAEEWANHLEGLVNNKSELFALSKKAKENDNYFSPKLFASNLAGIYQELVDQSSIAD